MGYDELAVAGALRGEPVELCQCLTVNEKAIANAEYVIEGEILPNVRVKEDQNSHTAVSYTHLMTVFTPTIIAEKACLV